MFNETRRNNPPKRFSSGLLAAAVVALLVAPGRTSARTFERTLGPDTTLESLAKMFYGSARKAFFIRAASGLSTSRGHKPPPGTVVQVPTAWTYRVRAADTWSHLGADYLGDPRRGPFLARFNGKNPDAPPPVRHLITIPCHLKFRAVKPTPLVAVVKRYLRKVRSSGRKRTAAMLQQYNFMERNVVESGRTILIPVMDLRVRP